MGGLSRGSDTGGDKGRWGRLAREINQNRGLRAAGGRDAVSGVQLYLEMKGSGHK